jgi:hypothetical protein
VGTREPPSLPAANPGPLSRREGGGDLRTQGWGRARSSGKSPVLVGWL